MRNKSKTIVWCAIVIVLGACIPEVPIQTPVPTEIIRTTPETLPPTEQSIDFDSSDGTVLIGSFFPTKNDPAPVVILMHQFGSNRLTWVQNGMVDWLQNMGASTNEMWPAMPEETSFAVFTFDFRGHGESGGKRTGERADFLMDAKAALITVQNFVAVDSQKIILIGASIGADAAVDICVEGCLGALSLSPGSYLEVPFDEVVAEMTLDNKPVWCLAAESDVFSANTCRSASGVSYRTVIYPSGGHGEELVRAGMDPDIGQLILEFLTLALSNSQ